MGMFKRKVKNEGKVRKLDRFESYILKFDRSIIHLSSSEYKAV